MRVGRARALKYRPGERIPGEMGIRARYRVRGLTGFPELRFRAAGWIFGGKGCYRHLSAALPRQSRYALIPVGSKRMFKNVISEGRIPEFCELHLKFEGAERNLCELRQRFDLSHHGKRYLLTLKCDALSVLPFRRREFIGDDSLTSRYSEDDWELPYQRVGFP